ncbi:hypothetical protein SAMN05192533_102313 [Mesobacillus persicus]|uniref:Uncharacterized protein n=1 Tax=Mesobacillus persicus TaxID=930146 RepID=A0A1H7XQI8_9BACI|nr:hypothetical protein [Mesobacillus persicus]SEM35894.1 hypothetical protein SAMN05192533_102313 [Mesobacillus persicus]
MNKLTKSISLMEEHDEIVLKAKMIDGNLQLVMTTDTTDLLFEIKKNFFESDQHVKWVTNLSNLKNV